MRDRPRTGVGRPQPFSAPPYTSLLSDLLWLVRYVLQRVKDRLVLCERFGNTPLATIESDERRYDNPRPEPSYLRPRQQRLVQVYTSLWFSFKCSPRIPYRGKQFRHRVGALEGLLAGQAGGRVVLPASAADPW